MAANFYLSTHANYHLHSKSSLVTARAQDLKFATPQELAWIEIWGGSVIQKLCKRLGLRQQVIATAIVYFRRFYLRNSFCETDSCLVASACCYVAAKAEETPVHVKSVIVEARTVFSDMGVANASFDNVQLAEMEFYLIEELDFHLIIFHPYRSLVQLCGRDGGSSESDSEERQRRESMLDIDDTALQMAWFVINDTFRSSLCLVYPPHLISVASIYLALSLHPPEVIVAHSVRELADVGPAARTRRQSTTSSADVASLSDSTLAPSSTLDHVGNLTRHAPCSTIVGGKTDAVAFLAALNVDMSIVVEIVQEIVSLYEVWNALEVVADAGIASTASSSSEKPGVGSGKGKTTTPGADEWVVHILSRMRSSYAKSMERIRANANASIGGDGKRAKVK